MKKRFGFTGQNITAKRDTSRPNLEFINANIDSLPTLEELKEQYAAAREQWNSMKHPATGISRIEMYNTSVNEATDAVSVSDMVEMFWYTTEKPSLFTANGIEITVQGKKYLTRFSPPPVSLIWNGADVTPTRSSMSSTILMT